MRTQFLPDPQVVTQASDALAALVRISAERDRKSPGGVFKIRRTRGESLTKNALRKPSGRMVWQITPPPCFPVAAP